MIHKKIIFALTFIVGQLYGTTSEKITLAIDGVSITPPSIKQDATHMFVSAHSIDPLLNKIIEASGGKSKDMIIDQTGKEIKIIADFATVLEKHDEAENIYEGYIGTTQAQNGDRTVFCKGTTCKVLGQKVHTFGNNVGIAENDICYFSNNIITCLSGKTFANPSQAQAATTGTPGYIMYQDKKFIGYIMSEPSKPGLMGSGKRIDFCQRACK